MDAWSRGYQEEAVRGTDTITIELYSEQLISLDNF